MQESTYDYIRRLCFEKRISIIKACELAGVHRTSIQRWKDKEPLTIQLFRKVEKSIIDYTPVKK